MTSNGLTAYMNTSVTTAGPAQLLVMLCERLVLDVERGIESLRTGGLAEANRHLNHAQDIVVELRGSLRVDAWEGGPQLAALYDYVNLTLVRANVRKDPALAVEALGLVEQLRGAWSDAALQSGRVA